MYPIDRRNQAISYPCSPPRLVPTHYRGFLWQTPTPRVRTAADHLLQRVWRPLYIDAMIAVQADTNDAALTGDPDGDFSDGAIHYALCDRLYSVLGLVGVTGGVAERVLARARENGL